MVKLSPEQLEAIEDLKSQKDLVKALHALLTNFVQHQETDVLRIVIAADNIQELALKKAKAEGANKILIDFRAHFGLTRLT